MNIKVDTKEFKSTLTDMKKFLSLEDFLIGITAIKDKIIIEAGDINFYYKKDIPAIVIDKCEFATTFKILNSISSNTENIEFDRTKNELNFKAGKFKGTLKILEDFNKVAKIRPIKEIKLTHSLDIDSLKTGFRLMLFKPMLINPEDFNYSIEIKKNKLFIITNDSYRGILYKTKLKAPDLSLTVSHLHFKKILDIMNYKSVSYGTDSKGRKIRFSNNSIDCYFPLIQGTSKIKASDIKKVVNLLQGEEPITTITFNSSDLFESIDAINKLYNNNTKTELKFIADKKELIVKSDVSIGDVENKIEIFKKAKGEFKSTMALMFDFLNNLKKEKLKDVTINVYKNKLLMFSKQDKYTINYVITLVTN